MTPEFLERDTNKLLQAIVASADDAIISRGLDGVITSWNAGAEQMFGYTAAEVVGRTLDYTLVPTDRLDEREEDTRRLALGETVRHTQTQRLRRDGTPVDVSVTLTPLRDEGGEVVGVSVIAREIGDRLASERHRRLREARVHQVERLDSLGQLAGGIAHDFNNLLAVILNYAGFVTGELEDANAIRADVEQIRTAATRAVALTRQLLAFAQRDPVKPLVFNLNEAITGAIDALRETVGPTVEIETALDPGLVDIDCDPTQTQQMLLHLASNARDAMPDGGRLRIETSNIELDENGEDEYADLRPGRYALLRVSDDGNGMSPEVLEHVFDPFFTTKPRGDGSGLGLPMIFGSVAQIGGTVRITSDEGIGTTCLVLLPAATRTPAPLRAVSAGERPGGATILVVDDEPAVREAVRRHLVSHGHTVLDCPDGEAAIALAEEYDEAIHLLLSDVLMPGLSGPQVAERIIEVRPGLPVLFMSGYAPELGGTITEEFHLVEKPFSEESLLQGVTEAIARARDRR